MSAKLKEAKRLRRAGKSGAFLNALDDYHITSYSVGRDPPVALIKDPKTGVWTVRNMKKRKEIPRNMRLFETDGDIQLYRKLREEGLTAKEAKDSMALMGIESTEKKGYIPPWYWSGAQKPENKHRFPHYHGKKRF